MKKTILKLMILCIVITGCFTACGTGEEGGATAPNSTNRMNIAMQMVPGFIPVYIMRDKGWLEEAFEEKGYEIKVTYTEFESGPPENESFAAGQQDVGVMGNVPGISGIAAGQKRDIIGISYNGEKTLGILIPSDSEVKNIKELKGKKIGIVIGSIAQDYLNEMLNIEGMGMEDVELINLGVSEMESSLATKQVDAIAIWNPTMLKIISNGTGKLLADGSGVYSAENVIVADREYITDNPDIVQIFMEQYQRAVDELYIHIDEYAKQYADIMGLSEELLKKTWEDTNMPVKLTEENQKSLEKTADFLYQQNLINKEVNISEYLDYSFSR